MREDALREIEEALTRPDVLERFWSKVGPVVGPKGCRLWTGGCSTPARGAPSNAERGRGRRFVSHPCGTVNIAGHTLRAPRVICFLKYGNWGDPGDMACHDCDESVCCNPAHLHWGNAKQNMQEAKDRGRARYFGRQQRAAKIKPTTPIKKTAA